MQTELYELLASRGEVSEGLASSSEPEVRERPGSVADMLQEVLGKVDEHRIIFLVVTK